MRHPWVFASLVSLSVVLGCGPEETPPNRPFNAVQTPSDGGQNNLVDPPDDSGTQITEDAGPDVTVDAGTIDAGGTQPVEDAGEPEPTDSGTTDAGQISPVDEDAGVTVDSGTVDAGPVSDPSHCTGLPDPSLPFYWTPEDHMYQDDEINDGIEYCIDFGEAYSIPEYILNPCGCRPLPGNAEINETGLSQECTQTATVSIYLQCHETCDNPGEISWIEMCYYPAHTGYEP